MTYQIKEKLFSIGNQFSILDEAGREAFYVKSQVFSWGKKLSFQDAAGMEIARIHQKVASWQPRYHILKGETQVAEILKKFTFFKPVFDMTLHGKGHVQINGNLVAHEFEFSHQGRSIANVSKKYWSWSDTYGVSIAEGEDDVVFLAACIVIDQVLHDGNKSHH